MYLCALVELGVAKNLELLFQYRPGQTRKCSDVSHKQMNTRISRPPVAAASCLWASTVLWLLASLKSSASDIVAGSCFSYCWYCCIVLLCSLRHLSLLLNCLLALGLATAPSTRAQVWIAQTLLNPGHIS